MSGETPAGGSRQTILCIDDDPLVLGVGTSALEAHGYRVLFATDPATGLAIAREERPDVILPDVLMPAMTGLEVCQQLRADPNLKDTPIILLTALEDAGVESMGEKPGRPSPSGSPSRRSPSWKPSSGCWAGNPAQAHCEGADGFRSRRRTWGRSG